MADAARVGDCLASFHPLIAERIRAEIGSHLIAQPPTQELSERLGR
jgi:hypothetical protein